jgi:hypothetical protein
MVNTTLQYVSEVLDKNHDGFVSLSEVIATENTPYWTAGLIPSMMLVDNSIGGGSYRFIEGLETRDVAGGVLPDIVFGRIPPLAITNPLYVIITVITAVALFSSIARLNIGIYF